MKKNILSSAFMAATFLFSSSAFSTPFSTLTGGLNVDNAFSAYISTDNNVQGDFIGSGNNWGVEYGISTTLDAGQDYFLHVAAEDKGWIASFLGNFTLTGGEHVFSNGSTHITTNNIDWQVSTTGWGNYTTATKHGDYGDWPWGTPSVTDTSADWIWSSNAYDDNNVYFTLRIDAVNPSVVPEPSIIALLGLGLISLGFTHRRKNLA